MRNAKVPLEVIRITKNCPADWNAMQQSANGRFCEHCRKVVHDLSTIKRRDAEELICASAGELCVRMQRSADGKVVTLDYQPGQGRGWKFWTATGIFGAILAAVGNVLVMGAKKPPASAAIMRGPKIPTTMPMLMGSIAPPMSSVSSNGKNCSGITGGK